MFRIATIIAVVAAFLIVGVGRFLQSKKGGGSSATDVGRFPWIDRLAARVCGLMFIGLALTGFYDILILNRAMTSWVLLVHVGLGGAFAVGLAAFTFLRAEGNAPGVEAANPALRKLCFWAFAASGLALILTAALAMVPWLGTEGQHRIIAMHRWFSLLAVVAAIGYLGLGRKQKSDERHRTISATSQKAEPAVSGHQ